MSAAWIVFVISWPIISVILVIMQFRFFERNGINRSSFEKKLGVVLCVIAAAVVSLFPAAIF